MRAGRMASPQKSKYRGYKDQFAGTIPAHAVTASDKDALIVLTRIGLRPGDNTDILEALGLIPTVQRVVPPAACADCAWVSSKPTNPTLALMVHRRAKHKVVAA